MLYSRRQRTASDNETDRFVLPSIVAIIAIVLVGVALQLIDFAVYDLRIRVLNSASDGGAFGLVGDIALAGTAVAAWLVLLRLRPLAPATVILPLLLTFLAFDKVARLHDKIPNWLVLYLPLLIATFVALLATASRMSMRSASLVGTGLMLLSTSFLLHLYAERILLDLGASLTGWVFQLKAAVKHGLEVAGWSLVSLGLVVGVRIIGEGRCRRVTAAGADGT